MGRPCPGAGANGVIEAILVTGDPACWPEYVKRNSRRGAVQKQVKGQEIPGGISIYNRKWGSWEQEAQKPKRVWCNLDICSHPNLLLKSPVLQVGCGGRYLDHRVDPSWMAWAIPLVISELSLWVHTDLWFKSVRRLPRHSPALAPAFAAWCACAPFIFCHDWL